MERFWNWYRNGIVLVVHTGVLLAAMLGGYALFASGEPKDIRGNAYYSSVSWGQAFWTEYDANNHYDYAPFTVWSNHPARGELFSFDEFGRRTTLGGCENGRTVWFFGGSVVWGLGVPDNMTVPSYYAQLTGDCVVNWGQTGYNSTQDTIQLVLALQTLQAPDVVIFYGGWNDLYTEWQTGRADGHTNLVQVSTEFSDTVRASFGGDVASIYAAHQRIVDALAKEYGFDVYWFWQPWINTTGKVLTPAEQQIQRDAGISQAGLVDEQNPAAIDLRGAFDDMAETVFLDTVHVTAAGNQRIAQRIAAILDT